MVVNGFIYVWKRNNWMLDPRSYSGRYRHSKIDRPVFLLGTQGGGLTLLSRMLRRNPDVVSVTGNSKYWAGADEMQNVYEPLLPAELSGIRLRAPKHSRYTPPRSWSYACDELIDVYRKSEHDVTDELRLKLSNVIGIALNRYGKKIENPRFLDKSQVFTVKLAFISELLKDHKPNFIHVTRNPYATCYRAAIGHAADMKRYAKFMDLDERMEICVQHWFNMARCVEEDREKVDNFMRVKFEDLLAFPERVLKVICRFIEIEFMDDMVPQAHHRLPRGIRFPKGWYPLVTNINEKYLTKIPPKYVELVYEKCHELAEMQGYFRPD
ncbi:sulfotransferase [Acidobacteriota bacterium]